MASGMGSVPLVLDNGSGVLKCGFAGADRPICGIPSAVGRVKSAWSRVVLGGELTGEKHMGKALTEHTGALQWKYAMEHGNIEHWDDMLSLWSHCFDACGTAPTDTTLLLTEAPLTPRAQREKTASVCFEKLGVPALHMASTSALCLYASGRTTGLVLESGDGVSAVTPIYEGFAMPHAVTRLDIAGRDITTQLLHHLRRSGHALHTSADFQIVRAIKEKLCYVSANPAADETAASASAVEYVLPDGNKIVLGAEVFRAPEVLFQPKLLGMEFPGLHEALGASALKAEGDIRATLLANIVLAGGSTAFKGFGNRLLSELKKITPPETKIKIWAPAERKILAWVGGSILSSLGTFRSMCITKERWEDEGARVLLSTGI